MNNLVWLPDTDSYCKKLLFSPHHTLSLSLERPCLVALSYTLIHHSWLLCPFAHLPLTTLSPPLLVNSQHLPPPPFLSLIQSYHSTVYTHSLSVSTVSCCVASFHSWRRRIAGMRETPSNSWLRFTLPSLLLALVYFDVSHSQLSSHLKESNPLTETDDGFFPMISPKGSPQPFIPFLAPSPLAPFTNTTLPKLSGMCPLNFTSLETMMSVTSMDCFSTFAPYLANVVCCPQLEATLVILIGQSSKYTNALALNKTIATHCLSDFQQLLVSSGANDDLRKICRVRPSNLTQGSCPVITVDEFENAVDSSKLLAACAKIDIVNECCTQICQNAILEAAQEIAKQNDTAVVMTGSRTYRTKAEDCRSIVLRWLASRLDASGAKEVLRGLSNCNVNKVCPLTFPDTKSLIKKCAHGMTNQRECCNAMEIYGTHLQNQSFTTNLQALNCAALLGMRLQKQNVTDNIYNICHVTLKDFSVQAGSQESGCLLQSLPSDVTFDQASGITFLCDLNDNIAAPWPSAYQVAASSCNKTVRLPALPAAASGQPGVSAGEFIHYLLLVLLIAVLILQ